MIADRFVVRLGSVLLWMSAIEPLFEAIIAAGQGRWLYAAWSAVAFVGLCLVGREVWRAS